MSRKDSIHEIKIGDDWTIPDPDGVGRRTLVQGAVWTVPVIAAAASAPLAAASNEPPFVCPVLAPSSQWAFVAPSSGTLEPGGGFGSRVNVQGPELYNTTEAIHGGTTAAENTAYTTMSVVAGHTYTLNFRAASNYGQFDIDKSWWSRLRLEVEGYGQLWIGASRDMNDPAYPIIPTNSSMNYTNYGNFSGTFTATTTGVVRVSFIWGLRAVNGASRTSQDDIAVTVPTVICS